LRANPPRARKPLPSNSSEDGSGAATLGVPLTVPPVRSPNIAGSFISKKKLPLAFVPPMIAKEPIQKVPAGPGQISFGIVLKTWGPKNDQTKSPPLGNASRSNNPPAPLEKKLRVAGAVKPVNVAEENVTSIDSAGKFAMPMDKLEQGGVDDDEHGEGTVKVKVNDASGAETALVEVSDA